MRSASLVLHTLCLAVTATAAPLAAQADPDKNVAGSGALPAGWHAHTERNAPLAALKFVSMGDGYHATMGPAAIFWRDADSVTGEYHTVATFTQTKAPMHPEAYGLIVGGQHLADSAQSYTYFLVRGDGMYSIRRRQGYANRPTAIVEWTVNDAVNKADGAGRATNELGVTVKGGRVQFLVNGKDVYSAAAADVDTKGTVGYRVNHNLDVHLTPIEVHRF